MSKKKVFVCSECGFVFPDELSQLIDDGTQVFCERCGKPFSLEGKSFTQRQFEAPEKRSYPRSFTKPLKKPKTYSSLNKTIQNLNKFTYIISLIGALVAFAMILEIIWNLDDWMLILIRQSLLGITGIIITAIDKRYISKHIQEGNYGDIFLDGFCIGILGCIIYGSGAFLLLKGILLILFVILNRKNTGENAYDIGLLAKNSLNHFSSKAGFIIIIFVFAALFGGGIEIQGEPFGLYLLYISPSNITKILPHLIVYGVFLLLAIIPLIIDYRLKNKIKYKQSFEVTDGVRTFILGVLSVMFFSAGIFILLKGILIFILYLAKPEGYKKEELQLKRETPQEQEPAKLVPQQKEEITPKPKLQEIESVKKPEKVEIAEDKKEQVKKEITKIKKEELEEKKIRESEISKYKEEEIETKLHESLLPVKNEKDKKLVKEYFAKIFAVLSKDIRERIIDLKIPKKEKQELLRELAFLTKEQQIKYIEAIITLYQERIPQKLIDKIRKLPNVKPENYEKIAKQLKYMDSEEQIEFIQFLEKYA
ncbi:MAG: hypothetical protein GF311_25470 [Candidatus Lokiarchaeota archaeon]|nr:hypothetical protein [Candidatus Lokiarchaeota archaeon]